MNAGTYCRAITLNGAKVAEKLAFNNPADALAAAYADSRTPLVGARRGADLNLIFAGSLSAACQSVIAPPAVISKGESVGLTRFKALKPMAKLRVSR